MKKPLGIISLLIGALGGTVGIAWAVASFGMVGFAINTYYTRRHLNYGVLDQGKDILPIVAACIPMLLSLYLLDRHWSAPAAMKLIIELAIGAGLFFTVSWGIRLNALRDIVALWRGRGSAVAEASET
jgi:hypothetical protein